MGIIGRVVLGIVVIAAPIAWAQNVPGRANKQTTIFSFPGGAGGGNSHSGLVQASDGNFYGTLFYGGDNNMGTVYRYGARSFQSIHSFASSDGGHPLAGLVEGPDHALYGTTSDLGPNNRGTIYRIGFDGTFAVLHAFTTAEGEGTSPLILATNGYFYGSSTGVAFKMALDGTFTALHTWGAEGFSQGGFIEANDGRLYATTYGKGSNAGAVVKMTRNGKLTVLHFFDTNLTEGDKPEGTLVQAPNGLLLGMCPFGGANGLGSIFEIKTSGAGFAVLHDFAYTDGASPFGGLTAHKGVFYGAAAGGGPNDDGTTFTVDITGLVTVLHEFDRADGASPFGNLIVATDGNLYSTTNNGGDANVGVIFKIKP